MKFSKNRLSKLVWIFDAIWVPTWPHFGLQNPPSSLKNPIPRGIQKLIDFCFDFWSIWAPFGGPSWGHVGHKDAPKTPQNRLQDASKYQEAPKRPQEAPRGPFCAHFGWFQGPIFGLCLIDFLVECWMIFDYPRRSKAAISATALGVRFLAFFCFF